MTTPLYLLVNIGCIECGVSSQIVGLFDSEVEANRLRAILGKKYYWREGGQNSFEVFSLPDLNVIHPEYEVNA